MLCERGKMLGGCLPIAGMDRLRKALLAPFADVEVELSFSMMGKGLPVITGTLSTQVLAECQRCLTPVELLVNSDVHLQVVVDDAAANHISDQWEPLVFGGDGQLSLAQIVEDELLVNLPAICLHEPAKCQQPDGHNELAVAADKPNPFKLLSQLKNAED